MAADVATRPTEGSPAGSGGGLAFAQKDKDDHDAPSDQSMGSYEDDDDEGKDKGKGKGKGKPQTPAPPPANPGGGAGSGGEDNPAEDDPEGDDPEGDDPAPGADPTPVLGRSVVVEVGAGTVLVRRPGSSEFVALGDGVTLPVGSVVDATKGRVELSAALASGGDTQTGTFWGGAFEIRQARGGGGLTQLVLTGRDLSRCERPVPRVRGAAAAMAAEDARRRPPSRHLWGSDSHGRFQTHGRDSVASVRGTRWLTLDTCAGTLTRVTEGSVAVRDLRAKRTVLVTAGHSYLARSAVRPSRAR